MVYEKVSWEQVGQGIHEIASWARRQNFKNIYGIPRGGLPLAVMLSHQLKLPVITSRLAVKEDTLVVDDICDSGKTLAEFSLLHIKTATLYYDNENAKVVPDKWCFLKKRLHLFFPWETRITSMNYRHSAIHKIWGE